MATLDEQVRGLLDRQEITDKINAYARSMDRCDVELGKSVFWPEAPARYGGMFDGTCQEFVEMAIKSHLENYLGHAHHLSNIKIDLDGDRATSETYGNVTLRRSATDGDGVEEIRLVGRYLDRWERRGDEWRSRERRFVLDLDQVRPVTPTGFATTGRRDRMDASYFADW